MATWRTLIQDAMDLHPGEGFGCVVASTFADGELDREFDDGLGATNGIPFTLWTARRVYFPIKYDGVETVGSVSRTPDGKPTPHDADWEEYGD